jgi:hypothetical protein
VHVTPHVRREVADVLFVALPFCQTLIMPHALTFFEEGKELLFWFFKRNLLLFVLIPFKGIQTILTLNKIYTKITNIYDLE